MEKSKTFRQLAVITALVLCSARAESADGDPIILGELDIAHTTSLFGATLGLNWAGFPTVLEPTYQGTNWWQQLDVTLPIYLTWQSTNQGRGTPVPISPVLISSKLSPQPGYEECPAYRALQTMINYDEATLYTTCANGQRLELPVQNAMAINADGTVRVRDIFGGTGEGTKIIFRKCFRGFCTNPTPCYEQGCAEDCHELVIVVLGWNHPGTYKDFSTGQNVNAAPGTDVVRRATFLSNLQPTDTIQVWYPQRTVMWASADFPGTSPGNIDAADISRLVPYLNPSTLVTWGFDNGPHNFEMNCNPFGSPDYITVADVSVLVAHLGHCCGAPPCQLPKAGGEDEASTILEWFGVARTGGQVVAGPSGETIPEYAIVDYDKARRAIADPYGYRNQTDSGGKAVPWGFVKKLFR